MSYKSISNLILVSLLFMKDSACLNDGFTTVEDICVSTDAYGVGDSDALTTTSSFSIAFIFGRIHTSTAASDASLDTRVCGPHTIPSSEEPAETPLSFKVSVSLKLAAQTPSTQKEVSTTSPTKSITTSSSMFSSKKRGVAYNDASLVSAFSNYPEVTWAYNWADGTLGIPSNIEYVPMLWGLGNHIQNWESNAEKAILSGTTHLLAFNEPDIDSQANLTIAAAVAGYLDHMQPFSGKAKLGSPAVTNGGGHMGLGWLKSFLSRCSSCKIDFVAIHWYNGGNAGAFKDYVLQAHENGGYRPVWVTEFRGPSSEEEEIMFLEEVLPWLDRQDYVHRYAYFMASEGSLISGRVLSRIGETFASFV